MYIFRLYCIYLYYIVYIYMGELQRLHYDRTGIIVSKENHHPPPTKRRFPAGSGSSSPSSPSSPSSSPSSLSSAASTSSSSSSSSSYVALSRASLCRFGLPFRGAFLFDIAFLLLTVLGEGRLLHWGIFACWTQ